MQTIYRVPRRIMSIAEHVTDPAAVVPWVGAGEILDGEGSFPIANSMFYVTNLAETCRRVVDYDHNEAERASLTVQMMHQDFQILRAALSGVVSSVAAGLVTDENLGDLAVGGRFRLAFLPDHDQTVDVADSLDAPLTEGTHYQWVAKAAGLAEVLDVNGFTGPFKVSYTKVLGQSMDPMENLNQYWMIALDGANEANACWGEREVFYKAKVTEATVQRFHEPAETQLPVATPVTFTLDRDTNRGNKFGTMDQRIAAAA